MNTQEEKLGHVYLKTDKSIAEVGKAIAEEFSNWRYDEENNQIYQAEGGRKQTLATWIIFLLFSIVMVFVYLPFGVAMIIAFVVVTIIYGEPKGIEDLVDFITIYELTESSTAEDPHPMTHVDFNLFDDDGGSNITEGDIMNIRERL